MASLSIEPRAVAAVEVAETASLFGGLDSEVSAGHVGIVAEREVGSLGAADTHGFTRVQPDSGPGVRSGADFEKNGHWRSLA
jgi:hypothetical protein